MSVDSVASCLRISVALGLPVWQLSDVRIKEVSQEARHPGGLGAPSRRGRRRIQVLLQHLCGVERGGAGLGRVETLHGAGQPDESLEALDVAAAVVHQLVLAHSSAAARRRRKGQDRGTLGTMR